MKTTRDIYQEITNQIVSALESYTENNTQTWQLPWHALNVIPKNAASGAKYRGINTVILWALGEKHGYSDALWATYKQWSELGAQVRKGEKGTTVMFWKAFTKDESEEAQSNSENNRPHLVARTYTVFNVAQVEGYTPTYPELNESTRLETADQFFSALGTTIKAAAQACYHQAEDIVFMPPFSSFLSAEGYYATLAHETIHWTGHTSRLNRNLQNRFGDESYAMEELIAELGAAFLCAELEVSNTPRPDHALYINSWLKALQQDKRAIFTAASKAQQALDWLQNSATFQQQAA